MKVLNSLPVVGLVVALGVVISDQVPTRGHDAKDAETLLAQTYSSTCETPKGVCFVPAKPLGSTCMCGLTRGSIVP